MKRFNLMFFASVFFCMLMNVSCAGTQDFSESENDSTGMSDAPCKECGTQGEIELEISGEKFYREWNPKAYKRLDSNAVVGVFPTLKVNAIRPEKCKFCHSFSEDAIDFDLARVEDSLFTKAFPKMTRELMLPGMRLIESDSAYIDSLTNVFTQTVFADRKILEDVTPWLERENVEQVFFRETPLQIKNVLENISSRYSLRYVSIPIIVEVYMNPDLGKSGGYTWKSLWTFWDARYGELVFLNYSEFTASTKSRIAPEKEWSLPFASRLWKMFSVDFSKIENH